MLMMKTLQKVFHVVYKNITLKIKVNVEKSVADKHGAIKGEFK